MTVRLCWSFQFTLNMYVQSVIKTTVYINLCPCVLSYINSASLKIPAIIPTWCLDNNDHLRLTQLRQSRKKKLHANVLSSGTNRQLDPDWFHKVEMKWMCEHQRAQTDQKAACGLKLRNNIVQLITFKAKENLKKKKSLIHKWHIHCVGAHPWWYNISIQANISLLLTGSG